MLSKHRNLLRQIPTDGSAITAGVLAARLSVSVRSVKNYISEILGEHPGLILSGSRGYRADRDCLAAVLQTEEHSVPDTQGKRVIYMIRRILEDDRGPVPIGAFEEELFVGEDTIKKDLPAMRRKLKEFDLFIDQRGDALFISGDEAAKRRMLSEIIYTEFNDNILSLQSIGKAFPSYDVAALKDLLIEACNEYHYFINEYALMNLVVDLLISIDRVKNNFLSASESRPYQFGAREQNLARAIVSKIEAIYGVTFNQFEFDELTLLLFGHLTKVDYKALTLENVSQSVGPESLRLIELITRELDVFEFLDFQNREFLLRFTVHIHNLLKRLECKYVTRNPLTEQIKSGCTFIYELAVLIAGIINRETGYFVDQHETAYIALHIGSMLQIQQSLRNKARCILVYPQYYDYANKLTEKLTDAFGTSLVFAGVATYTEELGAFGPAEMVLSTVELLPSPDYETVRISPFFTERDRQAVRAGLEAVLHRKKVERVKKSLIDITSPDMFLVGQSFANEEAAITLMAERMAEQGYVGPAFLETVLERERNYSTAYGDVAVPHSLEMNALKTGMFICLSDKGVSWGEHRVRIMLLFAVNREDKGRFYEVFENLIVLLLEPEHAQRVAASTTYGSFIEAILNCL